METCSYYRSEVMTEVTQGELAATSLSVFFGELNLSSYCKLKRLLYVERTRRPTRGVVV
jgi:hypothetical protein